MTRQLFLVALLGAVVAAASSCGPQVGAAVSGTVSGRAIKGPVREGAVIAYRTTVGEVGDRIASVNTDEQGSFSGLSVGAHRGPMVLCVSGGSYEEEATGTTTELPDQALCRLVEDFPLGGTLDVTITPWTHLAHALSRCLVRTGKEENLGAASRRARERLEAFLAAGDSTFSLDAVPLDATAAVAPSLTKEAWAGLLLAALSESAKGHAVASDLQPGVSLTASSLLSVLAQDIDDDQCLFDGLGAAGAPLRQGNVALSSDTLRGASMGLATSLVAFVRGPRNASGVLPVDVLARAEALAGHESDIFAPSLVEPDFVGPTITFVSPASPTLTGRVLLDVLVTDEVEVSSCAFTEPAVLGAIAPVFSEDKKECRLAYELNTSALPEAPLLIAVTATDATGNEASASLAGIVDNSLPTLTVTSPTADEVVSGVVTISATAADPSGIASLELVSLPGLIDIAPASDRLEVQWDTTTQFDGPLELEFLAIDENGLETTRKVQVEVDNIESTTISGVVSFVTPVNEASVTLYTYEGQVRGDEPLGKAVTDANGEFQLVIENPYSGVVLLAAVGGEFVDAASGQTMALGRELLVPITDLVAGDAYRKHLDPWSTLAVGRALADTTLPADVALAAALENVGLHLRRPEAIALCDTEVIDVTAGPASVGDDGTILGLASAALSRQAANLSVAAGGQPGLLSPSRLLDLLFADIADGVLDGRAGTTTIALTELSLATSYTTRVHLTTPLANFVSNKALNGELVERNQSGITVASVIAPGGLAHTLALDDRTTLYPQSSPPLPYDDDPPVITASFGDAHPGAIFGDSLYGEVELSFFATDAVSDIEYLEVIAPQGTLDLLGGDYDVLVRFDELVEPNVADAAEACGIALDDAEFDGVQDAENQVCVCTEAGDVNENVSTALLCFTRPPPTVRFLDPTPLDAAVVDGAFAIRAEVSEGFAVSSVTVSDADLADTSPDISLLYVDVPADYRQGDDGKVVLSVTATDLVGRSVTETRTFQRSPPEVTFSGITEGLQLDLDNLPRQYGATVTGGYAIQSCRWDILKEDGTVAKTGSAGSVASGSCVIQGTLVKTDLADGSYRMQVEAEDLAGRAVLAQAGFSKDTTPFSISVSAPIAGYITSATSLTLRGAVNDATGVTGVIAELTKPSGAIVQKAGSLTGTNITVELAAGDLAAAGTYSFRLTAATSSTVKSSTTRYFTIDRTAPVLVGHEVVAQEKVQQGRPNVGYSVPRFNVLKRVIYTADVEENVDWNLTPAFFQWTTWSTGPTYSFTVADDTSSYSKMNVRYCVGTAPLAQAVCNETLPATEGVYRASITPATSDVDLTAQDGSTTLYLTIFATDEAGNTTQRTVNFRWFAYAPPLIITANGSAFDHTSDAEDMTAWDESPQRVVNFVNGTEMAATGYVAAHLVIENPWSTAVQIQPVTTGFSLEYSSTRRLLAPNKRWASKWPGPNGVFYNLRNPRNAGADDSGSPNSTGAPRLGTFYQTDGGARYFAPLRENNDAVQSSQAMTTYASYYRSPDRVATSLGYDIYVTSTNKDSLGPNSVNMTPSLSVHVLEADGTLGNAITNSGGYYSIAANSKAVARWKVKHSTSSSALTLLPTAGDQHVVEYCPLLMKTVDNTTYSALIEGNDVLLATEDTYDACFHTVSSRNNTGFYCGDGENGRTACRLDKYWTTLDSIHVVGGAPMQQRTRAGSRTSQWEGTPYLTTSASREIRP